MKIKNEEEKKMIEKILTMEELETLKKAYQMMNNTTNQEYKTNLLRRIDDVISMIRYIELSYPFFNHADYDALAERMGNLRIAMNSISNPEKQESSFNYLADRNNTPVILSSLEMIDQMRFPEIEDLLLQIANNSGTEITIDDEVKIMIGDNYHIVFVRKDNDTMVVDLDSNLRPRITEDKIPYIKARCLNELEQGQDPTIQKIYDEMIFQALNFHMGQKNVGYRLSKKRGEER